MPTLRIVTDPEAAGGIGEPFASAHREGTLIHLGDDAEIVVSGLADGMQSGSPSMMFGFVLPDGRAVIAETSWKLFSAAYMAFASMFGDARPDASGLQLHYDTGPGQPVHLELLPDDEPQFFECELCGERIDEPPGVEGAHRIALWVRRHYRERHPSILPPE